MIVTPEAARVCDRRPRTAVDGIVAKPLYELVETEAFVTLTALAAVALAPVPFAQHTGALEKLAPARDTENAPDEFVVVEKEKNLHPETDPEEL